MSERIEELLYEEFPDLFQPIYRGQRAEVSVMDGWYSIVRELCLELIKTESRPIVHQVKEKFGALRFYVSAETEEQSNIIAEYEALSASVCEECGEPGSSRTELSWVKTLCDKHLEDRIARRKF